MPPLCALCYRWPRCLSAPGSWSWRGRWQISSSGSGRPSRKRMLRLCRSNRSAAWKPRFSLRRKRFVERIPSRGVLFSWARNTACSLKGLVSSVIYNIWRGGKTGRISIISFNSSLVSPLCVYIFLQMSMLYVWVVCWYGSPLVSPSDQWAECRPGEQTERGSVSASR